MNIALRLVLFLGALITLLFFLFQIRKNRLQIGYSIFWAFFSFSLVLFSVFPDIIGFVSKLLGFQAPVNFLFLLIIFIIVIKQFKDTIKLSLLEQKLTILAQKMALQEKNKKDNLNNY